MTQEIDLSEMLPMAIRDYLDAQEGLDVAKAQLKSMREEAGLSSFKDVTTGCTAHYREETRQVVDPVLLMARGVMPNVVAESASGVNRKKLLDRGVDPETMADCTTETTFKKCYVSKPKSRK